MTGTSPGLALSRSTARGAAWSYATFVITKGIVFLSTLVLARLLAPADFGLIALALVVMNHLDVINDFGIISAVIWRKEDVEHTSDVAFGLSLAIGAILSLLGLLVAPLVAGAYGEPRVADVLAALSVTFLIASFGSVQDARLRRALAFRRRFVAELTKAVVKAGTTIALAANGLGVWALVHGQIAGVTAGAIAYWILAGWRPRLVFAGPVARHLLGYGSQITLLGLLAVAASNVDYLMVGRRQGAVALGFYTLAFRLPGLLILNSCSVLSQVLFPAFAKMSREAGSLRPALLRALRALAALTVPCGVCIALVAPDLVFVLFGSRWEPTVPVVRWLAAYAVISTLLYNDGDVYKAIGRPVVLNAVTFVQLALAIPVLWWAAGSGIEAVAAAQVGIATAVLVLRLALLRSMLQIRVAEVARALLPIAVGALALAAGVVVARTAVAGLVAPIRLVSAVAAGAAAYAIGLAVADRRWALGMLRLFGAASGPEVVPEQVPLLPAPPG